MTQILEFIGNHPFLFIAAAALLALLIGGEIRARTRGFREVSSNDAVRLINGGARVIDVRNPDAFRKGHLIGAKNIPLEELPAKVEGLARDKEQSLLLYCDTGFSSAKAAGQLRRQGFADVHSLKGGIGAWQRDNLPTVKA